MSIPTIPLNDGRRIPSIGLGTYRLRGEEGTASVVAALHTGYRLLDTALKYENEREVGDGVRQSGLARKSLFVTTKLPGRHHGFDATKGSLRESLDNLGLDYVDLYLIHWPNPRRNLYADSWRAMIELREEGLTRSIGVSNFTTKHLERIIGETDVTPAVNQVELHPRFPQAEQLAFHREHGIVTESWSPLGQSSDIMSEDAVTRIAMAHGVTPTQIVLRWHVQLGTIPIPKSGDPSRQRENLGLFGFELTDDEVAAISALESGRLWEDDPDEEADPDEHEEL